MHNSPLVTVICLCYNQSNYVIEALESIKKQNYKPIEILIIDDCSEDNSVQVIQKWLEVNPNIVFIQNTSNLGNTKSFNKAARVANGDYLMDLAADDILLPDTISLLMQQFNESEYPNLGLVYGNMENIDENGFHLSHYFEVDKNQKVTQKRATGNVYLSILKGGNSICSPSALFKKSVFETLEGYDENLAYEDLDFWIRLSRHFEIDFIDAVVIQKRNVTNSLGSQFHQKKTSNKINHSTYLILKKAFQITKNKEENKALLKRIHYEILLNFNKQNFNLVLQLLLLKLKITAKIYFG